MVRKSDGLGKMLLKNWSAQVAFLLLLIFAIWWLFINPFNVETLVDRKHFWTASYFLLSLFGGTYGLFISRHWGGVRSVLGRSLAAFSLGLLLQTFGQVAYNFYTIVAQVETPYPSVGDIGYFGSIPAYIYGVILLGKAAGLRVSFRSLTNQFVAITLPLLMLIGSYWFFLRGYEFDWSNPLTVFLDFGYPLGQAIYVSIALLVLITSRRVLGGIMRKPLVLLLVALLIQYTGDFNFLFQAHRGAWYAGSWGDFLFVVSYFFMTVALFFIGTAFRKIKAS
ncbi:MAG: hypothetical protein V1895_03400 [Parcubacteria group bacterium]